MVLCGDKKHVKGYIEGINLLSSMRLCSNVPAQSLIPAAMDCLDTTNEMLVPGGRIYDQREFIYNAVSSIPGISVVKPKAAFYMFPKLDIHKFGIYDDEKFVLDFLKEKKILFTHGGGFHWPQPDHFRLIYLPCIEDLETAANALREFLETYHQ
jgi:alanine-synthesizing transaminase